MMIYSIFRYLIESTLYLISFLIIYRLFLSGLTHFNWMRVFLLGSLVLGLILPLITLPPGWHYLLPGAGTIDKPLHLRLLKIDTALSPQQAGIPATIQGPVTFRGILVPALMIIYLIVAVYKLVLLSKKLISIRNNIKNNPAEKKDQYRFIQLDTALPAYSFFNYIFISKHLAVISDEEIERIESHEIIHSKQYHTLDILFVELVSVVLWFNPLIKFYKEHLQEVHEYSADAMILKNKAMKHSYSNLLLRLTAVEKPPIPSSAFSAKQINRRIRMIEKSRSRPRYRFLFFLLLPLAVFLLTSFSYLENRASAAPGTGDLLPEQTSNTGQLKVGHISWIDNTLYTEAQLSKKLGIDRGDDYSPDVLNQRLWTDEDAVCGLYLDNGYLFFNAEIEEVPDNNDIMNLNITIYEGVQVKIGKIQIAGNGSVPEEDIMEKILVKPGELFSRIKLIQSVRAIGRMGPFDPENIAVNPTPVQDPLNEKLPLVDIEFRLSEK